MDKSFEFSIYQPFGEGHGCNPAVTLSPRHIGTHDNGWTIEGEIKEDYYEWVNEFSASHPDHGEVWGDFEDTIYASSKEAYEEFVKHFQPDLWDYLDI